MSKLDVLNSIFGGEATKDRLYDALHNYESCKRGLLYGRSMPRNIVQRLELLNRQIEHYRQLCAPRKIAVQLVGLAHDLRNGYIGFKAGGLGFLIIDMPYEQKEAMMTLLVDLGWQEVDSEDGLTVHWLPPSRMRARLPITIERDSRSFAIA